jgi:hypothetical protein
MERKRKLCDTTQEVVADQDGCIAETRHTDVNEGDLIAIVDCDKLFDITNWKRGVLSGVALKVHYPARVLKVLENGNVRVQWIGFENVNGCGPFDIELSDLRISTAKSSQDLQKFCEMYPRLPVPDIHISKECIDDIRTTHSLKIANYTRASKLRTLENSECTENSKKKDRKTRKPSGAGFRFAEPMGERTRIAELMGERTSADNNISGKACACFEIFVIDDDDELTANECHFSLPKASPALPHPRLHISLAMLPSEIGSDDPIMPASEMAPNHRASWAQAGR